MAVVYTVNHKGPIRECRHPPLDPAHRAVFDQREIFPRQ